MAKEKPAPKQIDSLTPEQEALMPQYRDKYIAVGLSTEPADFDKAERAVRECFKLINEEPLAILRCQSPMEAHVLPMLMETALRAVSSTAGQQFLSDMIAGRLAKSTADADKAFLENFTAACKVMKVEPAAIMKLILSLSPMIEVDKLPIDDEGTIEAEREKRSRRNYTPEQMSFLCGESPLSEMSRIFAAECLSEAVTRETAREYLGQHYAGFVAFVTYCQEVLGVEIPASFQLNKDLVESCGWIRWGRITAISDRPSAIHIDANNRLHNESGPAVEYRDGWKIWYINNIACTEQVVMAPETQTIDQMMNEPNMDLRAIRIERFGWPRFIKESGAECLDERANDVEGTHEALYHVTLDDSLRLVATCATGKIVCMALPTSVDGKPIRTCQQAQNWLANLPLDAKSRILGRT